MADGENGFLLKRISELERLVEIKIADYKKARHQSRLASEELKTIREERDVLAREREALQASPNEWRAKYEDLQKDLKARDHKDAWLKIVGPELADKVPLDEVFGKIQYQVGDSVPSESEIRKLAQQAREVAPYLFRQESEPGAIAPQGAPSAPQGANAASRSPAQVPFDASRGERDTGSSKFRVLRSDMRNPRFMMTHSKAIAEASAKGILDIVPD
jgi:hypothetical protein